MPLRKILSRSDLSAEDIALLEALFNQAASRFATEEERLELARDLVALFSAGIRDETELIGRIARRRTSVTNDP